MPTSAAQFGVVNNKIYVGFCSSIGENSKFGDSEDIAVVGQAAPKVIHF